MWCTCWRSPGRTSPALHPHVLREPRRDIEILILDGPGSRHLVLHRHLEHHVGCADMPALCELGQRRQLRRAAFARAARHPGRDRVDLRLRQAQVVAEFPVTPVGVPRRHLARRHLLVNRTRPGPGLAEGDERHRRHLALPVAGDALLVEDRRDVLAERRPALLRERLAAQRHAQRKSDRGTEKTGTNHVAAHVFLRCMDVTYFVTIPPPPPRVTPRCHGRRRFRVW